MEKGVAVVGDDLVVGSDGGSEILADPVASKLHSLNQWIEGKKVEQAEREAIINEDDFDDDSPSMKSTWEV